MKTAQMAWVLSSKKIGWFNSEILSKKRSQKRCSTNDVLDLMAYIQHFSSSNILLFPEKEAKSTPRNDVSRSNGIYTTILGVLICPMRKKKPWKIVSPLRGVLLTKYIFFHAKEEYN
jgi:hypothetical protein